MKADLIAPNRPRYAIFLPVWRNVTAKVALLQAPLTGYVRCMNDGSAIVELRRCALGVSVLNEMDLMVSAAGVTISGLPEVEVSWDECALAIGDAEPASDVARARLARWLHTRRWLADKSLEELSEIARPVGLPVGHILHPGPGWAQRHVHGDVLDLGVGFLGLRPGEPDLVEVCPQGALDAAGLDVTPWWSTCVDYLENIGALAAVRWRRDPRAPLRPLGDCDVVTLLGSDLFRGAVASAAGGMRAVAVPMRNRGWLDLSRIDPAFALAAAAITDEEDRGFPRPLLLTFDEVVIAAEGGRPAEIVLRDGAVAQPFYRDVMYR